MKSINDVIDVEKGRRELAGDRITVGVATCGISAGAMPTLRALQEANLGILVEPVGCAGMCYNEPIVTVRRNGKFSIYAHATKETAGELTDSVKNGRECERLLVGHDLSEIDDYKKQHRWVMENCGLIN
ncbi:MAG: (2Fe-2S) ferredoxin domain-containing protein, partial [Candidatus Altiarchaeota archaeon]|nr:(2Fe-2S) ferredoxin domain-containing protein [Candidatus Altiarchaeota archaeon]